MLGQPPPGYNVNPINQQDVAMLNNPGRQGQLAQGFLANQFRSNYSLPSNYAPPSSLPTQNSFYSQGQSNPLALMQKALMRGR